jgi:hypothetical protein
LFSESGTWGETANGQSLRIKMADALTTATLSETSSSGFAQLGPARGAMTPRLPGTVASAQSTVP